MPWTKIEPSPDVHETNLQDCIDRWDDFADQIAGAPKWLRSAMAWPAVKPVPSIDTELGYTNNPDVIRAKPTASEAFVLELKYGVKYEPLVVAQVLCAAYWLKAQGHYKTVHTGIVGQYSIMNRSAIQRLIDDGLPSESLHYAEVQIFDGPGNKRLFFFDAPFSNHWERKSPPSEIETGYERHKHWYHVEASDTWYGFELPQADSKPLFITGEWTQVSSMSGGYLGWTGKHDEVGTAQIWQAT